MVINELGWVADGWDDSQAGRDEVGEGISILSIVASSSLWCKL